MATDSTLLTPALQGLPPLDAQKLADRAAVKAAIAPPLAAAADIGTLPQRFVMGTANLLGRGVNMLLPQGTNIPPIPQSAFGGNSASLTPYSDALNAPTNTGSVGGSFAPTAAPSVGGAVPNAGPAPQVPAVSGGGQGYDFPPVSFAPAAQPASAAAPTGTPWSIVKTLRNDDGSAGKVTRYSGVNAAPAANTALPAAAATPPSGAYQQRIADQERIVSLAQQAAPNNVTAQLHIISALAGGFTPGSDTAHVLGAQIGVGGSLAATGLHIGEQAREFNETPRLLGSELTMTPFGPSTTSTYGMQPGATPLISVSPAKPVAKPAEGATGTLKDGRRFVIQNGEPVLVK